MNSGQMTSISTASTRRLVLPFWVYIGKTTRCCRPFTAVLLRLEGLQRVQEVGHAEAAVGPAAEVGDEEREVVGVVREGRCQGLDGRRDGADIPGGRLMVGGLRNGAVLDLERLQGGGGGLELQPFRGGGRDRGSGGESGGGHRSGHLSLCWERRSSVAKSSVASRSGFLMQNWLEHKKVCGKWAVRPCQLQQRRGCLGFSG